MSSTALTICTGWSPQGFAAYGRTFLERFTQNVAGDVRLLAYVEEIPKPHPRAEFVSLWDCEGVAEFLSRHSKDPVRCGRKPSERWKEKELAKGYSFRFDAVKFCRQGFIPLHAASKVGRGLLAWFDADAIFKAPVAAREIAALLPASAEIAYLGRPGKHSEIGFQLYSIPHALPHLQLFRDLYATDAIFAEREWHSAFAFDLARERSGVRAHSLTPQGKGNVWPTTPLGRFSDHFKGDRKQGIG